MLDLLKSEEKSKDEIGAEFDLLLAMINMDTKKDS